MGILGTIASWRGLLLCASVIALLIYALYSRIFTTREGAWYDKRQYYGYMESLLGVDDKKVRGWKARAVDAFHPDRGKASPRVERGGDSSGERECRRVLARMYNRPFEKARPDFLRNPVTGGSHNLELDCYDERLGIACEYNGRQHYEFVPFFHKTRDAFHNLKYRDQFKRQRCKERGVFLIEVPYTIANDDIERFIADILNDR
jgi:hypothetical protein